MKIVIADDEPLARLNLVSMIGEMDAEWEIAGEAAHGEELLELLARHHPEVAVVDIRMPKLDGIEAIRRGSAISPQTKWIILSGFSDFGYAQQALKLGVGEYLLKPVVPDELEKAIRSVCAQNREYALLLNCRFENRFISLVQGLASPDDEPADSLLRAGNFQALVFCFDSPLDSRRLEEIKCEFNAAARRCIPDCLVYGAQLALFMLPESGFVAAAGVWDPAREKARQSVQAFFRHAEETAARFRSGGNQAPAITAIATERCRDFKAFSRQLRQIEEWAGIEAVLGINRTWPFREVWRRAETGLLELGKYFHRLAGGYRNGLYLDFQHTLDQLRLWLSRNAGNLPGETVRRNIREYAGAALDISLPDADWKEWIRILEKRGESMLRNQADAPPPQALIDQVLRYVGENYMNNIGLNRIAAELNVNPSYLSTLFHKKTGVTFIKYLTRLRILKAKELLIGTRLPIRQVAERVGYYSTRYFTKLFVETVGVYPSDFRKSKAASGDDELPEALPAPRGEKHAKP